MKNILIKLKYIFHFTAFEFLFNGHPQSLGASAIVYLSDLVLGNINSFYTYFVVYFVFQFVYLHDRYVFIVSDELSNSARTKHLRRYQAFIPGILIVNFSAAVVISILSLNKFVMLYSLFIMFMGYLYPKYFKHLTKKLFFFKNIYVSLVFSILVFYSTIASKNINHETPYLHLSLFVFIESMIVQFLLDIKDIKSDSKEKLKTLPIVAGESKTYIISLTISLLSLFYSAWLSEKMQLFMLLGVLSFLINLVSVFLLKTRKPFGSILVASKFFLWWGVLLCFN